jgi:hypothetical protein
MRARSCPPPTSGLLDFWCPSEDLIARFAHGLLSREQAASIEAHLDRCRDCSALVVMLGKLGATDALSAPGGVQTAETDLACVWQAPPNDVPVVSAAEPTSDRSAPSGSRTPRPRAQGVRVLALVVTAELALALAHTVWSAVALPSLTQVELYRAAAGSGGVEAVALLAAAAYVVIWAPVGGLCALAYTSAGCVLPRKSPTCSSRPMLARMGACRCVQLTGQRHHARGRSQVPLCRGGPQPIALPTRVPTAPVRLCRDAKAVGGGVATGPPWRSPARYPRPLVRFSDTWVTLATRGPFCRYVGTSRSRQILPLSKPPTTRSLSARRQRRPRRFHRPVDICLAVRRRNERRLELRRWPVDPALEQPPVPPREPRPVCLKDVVVRAQRPRVEEQGGRPAGSCRGGVGSDELRDR